MLNTIDSQREMVVRAPDVRTKLSVALADSIAEETATGVSEYAAAGLNGVAPLTFRKWLERGRADWEEALEEEGEPHVISVYAYLYLQVLKKASGARASAERRVHIDKPEIWLTKGPARREWGDGQGGGATSVSVSVSSQHTTAIVQPTMTEDQLLEVANILQQIGYVPQLPSVVESDPSNVTGDSNVER